MSDVDLKEPLAAVNWLVGRYGLDELLVDVPLGRLAALVDDVDEAVVYKVKEFVSGPQMPQDDASKKTKTFVRRLGIVVTKALEGRDLEPVERETIGEAIGTLTDLLARG